jgi:putative transposase
MKLESNKIPGISVPKERNILIVERVIYSYNRHSIFRDGGTWYPQAGRFLRLKHHLHSSFEKSLIESTVQFV